MKSKFPSGSYSVFIRTGGKNEFRQIGCTVAESIERTFAPDSKAIFAHHQTGQAFDRSGNKVEGDK